MASNIPPSSNFPPSMGPGARPLQPGENLSVGDTARAVQEMRSHYQVRVEPTELKVSYDLNNQVRGFTIPFDAIPMSSTWKWVMYGGSARAYVSGTFFLDTIRGVENMAQRRLTQKEAEGFALHTGKRMQYAMMGSGFSVLGGIGLASWGYKSMKFPFRPVKPIEAYDVFPAERLAILRGQFARSAWQITRVNIYIALTMVLVNPFFRSMGDSVMTVGLFRDERTNAVVKEVKGSFDRIRMNRTLPGQQQSAPKPSSSEQSMEETNAQDFYAKDSSSESYYGNSSDYSSSDNSFTDNTTDTGALSDSAMRNRESKQPPPNSFGRTRYDRSADPNQQPSQSGFFDDDASPTSGNDPDMSTQFNSSNSSSAWDRYRRGSPPSSPQSQTSPQPGPYPSPSDQSQTTQPMQETRRWRSSRQQGQTQDFETKGDSFSFSNSDEQRALAKEQAQREFNEMLDRERNESGSGEYSGGTYAAQNGMEDAGQGKEGGGSAWDRRRRG